MHEFFSPIKPWLRNQSWATTTRDKMAFFRAYGTLAPSIIALKGGNSIVVDRSEPRGRAILGSRASGQPIVKKIWCNAVEKLSPDTVIDVGVNYGELLFMPTYEKGTRVIGVEVMPSLHSFLKMSHSLHPSREDIVLHECGAGRDTGYLELHVDTSWSGRSSLHKSSRVRAPKTFRVPVVRLDDISPKDVKVLLIKIDTEGYETFVFDGAERLLASNNVLGIAELNGSALVEQGTSLESHLGRLQQFSPNILALYQDELHERSWLESQELSGINCDLIFASSREMLEKAAGFLLR